MGGVVRATPALYLAIALVVAALACRTEPSERDGRHRTAACSDDPRTLALIDAVRTDAEEQCGTRGYECDARPQCERYAECVRGEVAAAVERGALPRPCQSRAELSAERIEQLRSNLIPDF